VLSKVVEANCQCVWNIPLVDTMSSLQLQGYVCPGMLVLLTSEHGMQILKDSWFKRTLVSPEGFKIYRLGLSSGCSVTPFQQGPSLSLQDAICWILLHFKQTGKAANMHNIIEKVVADFPGLSTSKHMTATVHQALGVLIKSRKVYYTGKGYFLVTPDNVVVPRMKLPDTCQSSNNWSIRMRQDRAIQTDSDSASASCWPVELNGTTNAVGAATKQQPTRKLWSAPRPAVSEDKSNKTRSNGWKPRCSPISPNCQLPNRSSPGARRKSSQAHAEFQDTDLLPDSRKSQHMFNNRNLHRSQSLRLPKDSKRKIVKGGSLRLAKEEAKALLDAKNVVKKSEDLTASSVPIHKPLERKDSILGRLFSRKKSHKEIRVFSGQFPPPDLEASLQTSLNLQPPGSKSLEGRIDHDKCETNRQFEKLSLHNSSSLSGLSAEKSPPLSRISYKLSESKVTLPEEHIYSVPITPAPKPLPPYSPAPPYQNPPRLSISQLHLSKSIAPPKRVQFSPSPPKTRKGPSLRIRSPPARRSLKYQSLSSGSSSTSGPSSIESVLDSNVASDSSDMRIERTNNDRVDERHVKAISYKDIVDANDETAVNQDQLSNYSSSSSLSTVKPSSIGEHPSLSDLGSITDLSGKFQSLTARKMLAGLSTGSIDTLVEINAAHEKHESVGSHNESTETIDFGII